MSGNMARLCGAAALELQCTSSIPRQRLQVTRITTKLVRHKRSTSKVRHNTRRTHMRKLLLIAMLVLSTLAWAQKSGSHMGKGQRSDLQTQQSGDWYNQTLAAQADQFTRINATQAPSAIAFEEQENLGVAQPGSMAAAPGSQGQDFYNQKLAIQSEVSRRD